MKKVTFFIFLATLIAYSATGQVVESKQLMSLGQNTALSVDLIHTDREDVEKAWIKYIKEFDGKTKKNAAREILTDDATIAAMSRNTIDIYTVINEKGDDAELIVWFDLGGAFLNSEWHPDRFPVAEKMLSDFAQKVSRGAVETELATQEADLQKLSDKLISLRQDKQSLERNIMEYAEKIAVARKKIEDLNIEYEQTKEKQASQEASVEAVKARLKEFSGLAKK